MIDEYILVSIESATRSILPILEESGFYVLPLFEGYMPLICTFQYFNYNSDERRMGYTVGTIPYFNYTVSLLALVICS